MGPGASSGADAAGANVEEFVPAPGGLNTGLSTQIRDEANAGQGMASFDKNWELALTHTTLPGSTTFYMGTNEDWRDQKMKADAEKARADKLKVYVDAGALSAMQMLNAAVDAGDLDQAFLPKDATEAGDINDNEKLITGDAQARMPVITPLPSAQPQQQQAPGAPVTKEDQEWADRSMPLFRRAADAGTQLRDQLKAADATDALIDQELAGALEWARKARGDDSSNV